MNNKTFDPNLPGVNPTRAVFERNISASFFATLDSDPTLAEEFLFHRMQVSQEFIDWVNNSPVYAHLERRIREMFLDANDALLSANPHDAPTIAEAQVQMLAATTLMSIISDAVRDGEVAKQERKQRNEANA